MGRFFCDGFCFTYWLLLHELFQCSEHWISLEGKNCWGELDCKTEDPCLTASLLVCLGRMQGAICFTFLHIKELIWKLVSGDLTWDLLRSAVFLTCCLYDLEERTWLKTQLWWINVQGLFWVLVVVWSLVWVFCLFLFVWFGFGLGFLLLVGWLGFLTFYSPPPPCLGRWFKNEKLVCAWSKTNFKGHSSVMGGFNSSS